MAELPQPKTPTPERQIYSVEEFQALLHAAEEIYTPLLPYVVLTGFCFLRTSELVRKYRNEQVLQLNDVLWQEGLIHVSQSVAKTTSSHTNDRLIPPFRRSEEVARTIPR
jgi:hypothetical protein